MKGASTYPQSVNSSPRVQLLPGVTVAGLVLYGGILLLCGMHFWFLTLSQFAPSWDEAHYMGGALGISRALKSGSPPAAWHAFVHALGFKAPLICVPAGVLMLLPLDPILAARLSLLLIFVGIGILANRLFRHILCPLSAAIAALILCSTPLITGLTHRFYVEGLLLLLLLAYLDMLVRWRARTYRHASALGVMAGLGTLCKISFVPLAGLATLYGAAVELYGCRQDRKAVREALGHYAALAGAAALVALPWYYVNWKAFLAHARMAAFECGGCDYPLGRSFLAAISAAPQLWTVILACIGLVPLVRALVRNKKTDERSMAWLFLLLLAAAGLAMFLGGQNKAVRFLVPFLPAVAALCVWTVENVLFRKLGSRAALFACAGFALLGAAHNCFDILPMHSARYGDLRLIDSSFPLNIPGWFDDNHPLDTRDLHFREAERFVAADWVANGQRGVAVVGLTFDGLALSRDYLVLVADIEGLALSFLPAGQLNAVDSNGPDYILVCSGCMKLYASTWGLERYPDLLELVSKGAVPYKTAFSKRGPGGITVAILRKVRLSSLASASGAKVIEAEDFTRANVDIDRGGFGAGIGVITSPKPPAFAEYMLTVASAGSYQLELRCASAERRPVTVRLNGEKVNDSACAEITGGWGPEAQAWQPVGVYRFEAGANLLRLERSGPIPHIDKLAVILAGSNVVRR